MDERSVLVICGKDQRLQGSMFRFLRAIGLCPVLAEHYRRRTQRGAVDPHEALLTALRNVCAVLILLTGDDEAKVRYPRRMPEYYQEDRLHPPFQPQLHVLFAAGMALAVCPGKTILLKRGHLRPCSNLADHGIIELGDSTEQRSALIEELQAAGCTIDRSNHQWLRTGDFSDPDMPE